MAKYVDGFVLVVPKSKRAVYKKMAQEGADMWKKFGALEYFECRGDDMVPKSDPNWKPLPFPKLAKAKPNEDVWFSYIVFKNKKHRDEVNKRVIAQMNKAKEEYKDVPMPFDMKRFSYGGFEVVVES